MIHSQIQKGIDGTKIKTIEIVCNTAKEYAEGIKSIDTLREEANSQGYKADILITGTYIEAAKQNAIDAYHKNVRGFKRKMKLSKIGSKDIHVGDNATQKSLVERIMTHFKPARKQIISIEGSELKITNYKNDQEESSVTAKLFDYDILKQAIKRYER